MARHLKCAGCSLGAVGHGIEQPLSSGLSLQSNLRQESMRDVMRKGPYASYSFYLVSRLCGGGVGGRKSTLDVSPNIPVVDRTETVEPRINRSSPGV